MPAGELADVRKEVRRQVRRSEVRRLRHNLGTKKRPPYVPSPCHKFAM